jgi:hypothetical protein
MAASGARCLILNASMEPLSIVSARRGLTLALTGRVDILEKKDLQW